MAIEHVRVCGACERECPGWANRCPACGSLSLLHRITFVPAPVVAPHVSRSRAELAGRPSAPSAEDFGVTPKPARKSAARLRIAASCEATLLKAPLGGEPETRVV
jgi:predicted ATP-dependent serine protease